MPRITVVAERNVVDPILERLDIKSKEPEFVWRKLCMLSEEIFEFEELNDAETQIITFEGGRIVIQESFTEFEARLKMIEENIDPISLAEQIAEHLAILTIEASKNEEENT